MSRDQLLGTFEQLVLLSILHAGEEAYGPVILKRIEGMTGRSVSRGSLYVTLDRLERKEMLRSEAGEPEPGRGGRPKRFVSVTKRGVEALREAHDSLTALWAGLEAVLSK